MPTWFITTWGERAGQTSWEQSGVEWNHSNGPIELWHITDEVAVFKIPGGKHWAGIGSPWKPHGALFYVMSVTQRLDDEEGRPKHLLGEEITSFPVSRRTK